MARSERTRSPRNGGASAGQRAVRSRPRSALRQDQPTPPDQAEFVLCEQTIFTIFQDHDGIAFGQHWPSRLDEALAGARFLVPVLSPSFFRSGPCRDELAK